MNPATQPPRSPAQAGASASWALPSLRSPPPRGRTGQAIRFAGYAALFGKADAARDTIRPGAFARSLAERKDPLPLYFQHRPEQRIGWVETVAEDARGLRVIARIDDPASRAALLLKDKAIDGLSFGYRARAFRGFAGGRLLEDIELVEVSLVTHPLQHGARVHLILG